MWDRGLKIKAGTNDAHSRREKSIKIENTVIIITYLLHPVLNINIAQIFTQMTIIHAVISCLTVSHFNEGRKNESGTKQNSFLQILPLCVIKKKCIMLL